MERVARRLEQVSEHLWVVLLEGEYDRSNADQVDALEEAFDAGSTVILDLQDVTSIDSMVLGVIAKARIRALSSGGAHRFAVVVEPDSHIERALHIGFDHYLDLFDDLDAALEAMSPTRPLPAG
jgi:anti-anti-sigma factor